MITHKNEWLERRKNGIGGSDAACILGLNPWKTNVDLWMEKTGRVIPDDISDKECIRYGVDAEPLLRELFAIDFPKYKVFYDQFGMFRNKKYPWIFATLDGWYETPLGDLGVLEIKTTEIKRYSQWKAWKDAVPQHYYIQVLHQLLATGFQEATLKAQIKSERSGVPYSVTRHYLFDAEDLQIKADMAYLLEKEIEFWNFVQQDIQPALLLPGI